MRYTTAAAAIVIAGSVTCLAPAQAATFAMIDDLPGGVEGFADAVTSQSLSTVTDIWNQFNGTSIVLPLDQSPFYTLSRNDGSDFGSGETALYNAGFLVELGRGGQLVEGETRGLDFRFDLPIREFALPLYGWGDETEPAKLYVSFDGGPPVELPAFRGENGIDMTEGNSIAMLRAYATDGSFSQFQLWTDNAEDSILAGGTIRLGFGKGTENPSDVPLPAAAWLLLSAVGTVAGFGRWKKAQLNKEAP
jgi:hypothetical protein